MVGIVIVSHSARLAEGAAELAREMGGAEVPIAAAGGTDEPDALGTDAVRVMDAIERVGEGGALVLMDLGSAVLSAETALDLLAEEVRDRVLLCEAPLVEGAVAAAAASRAGGTLEEVATEARNGLAGKVAHLGTAPASAPEAAAAPDDEGWSVAEVVVGGAHGLHARPAAAVVRAAADLDAEVRVRNLTAAGPPASARSLTALATLNAREGDRVGVEARGAQAQAALAAVTAIIEGSEAPPSSPPPGEAPVAPPAAGEVLEGVPAAPGRGMGAARVLGADGPPTSREPAGTPDDERRALDGALAGAPSRAGIDRGRRRSADARDPGGPGAAAGGRGARRAGGPGRRRRGLGGGGVGRRHAGGRGDLRRARRSLSARAGRRRARGGAPGGRAAHRLGVRAGAPRASSSPTSSAPPRSRRSTPRASPASPRREEGPPLTRRSSRARWRSPPWPASVRA